MTSDDNACEPFYFTLLQEGVGDAIAIETEAQVHRR
jgi:hypothetical protein